MGEVVNLSREHGFKKYRSAEGVSTQAQELLDFLRDCHPKTPTMEGMKEALGYQGIFVIERHLCQLKIRGLINENNQPINFGEK